MLQELTIRAESIDTLKPLLEVAIRNQLKSLQHGINRTKEELAKFEARFGMTSDELERRLKSGELKETMDTIDWWMEITALRLLEGQHKSLSEASLD
ncbi:MAG: hypothetical protein HY867_02055 [Chloroflexi bacterium]|nr:hypothetical protein [Chloroflexota bacterium]